MNINITPERSPFVPGQLASGNYQSPTEILQVAFVIVGRKASQYFQRREQPIAATFTCLEQIPTAMEANKIGDKITALFLGEEVDRVELVYTKFVSLIASSPVIQTLLPLSPQGLEVKDDEVFRLTGGSE